ncbi:MAG TPA: LysR family transcriptional regulator [Crenotrichaceae bacterium]|nr:LysR family transcriptional regulator [Crenotrichaceae bacterium]
MIELSHLRIISALHENGTLTEAANALCLSQSALSHQIRYLEKKLELKLWQREGRGLRLTQAGNLLLQVAQQVLPMMDHAGSTLKAYAAGRQGILRIGVECYPCYEWLTGVIADFLLAMPEVDIDIAHQFQFSGLEGLLNHQFDVLVTPDIISNKTLVYAPLFDYELVLLASKEHLFAGLEMITPEMLATEVLLTFPVPAERLDIFTQFLFPASIAPAQHKQIQSIDIMMQMVVYNRGVCVLPDWLADNYCSKLPVSKVRLGRKGVHKTLFAGMHCYDAEIPYIKRFVRLGQGLD